MHVSLSIEPYPAVLALRLARHENELLVTTVGRRGSCRLIAGQSFYTFDAAENPRSVPWESVTEVVFFDED